MGIMGSRDSARLERMMLLGCSSSLRILHCLFALHPLPSTIRRHRNSGIRAVNHLINSDSVNCRNEIRRIFSISPGPTFLIELPPQGDHNPQTSS
jgi:hypothetical protein